MFINTKAEKDQKAKELQLLKEEQAPAVDVKELRIKYENLKVLHQKELTQRKDKEAKFETINAEMQKKNKSLDDLYSQIEEIYEASNALQTEVDKLKQDLGNEKLQNQQL